MAPRCENAGTARHKMSGKIAEPNHLLWIMTGDHTTAKKHLQGNRITISNSGIRTAHIGKFPGKYRYFSGLRPISLNCFLLEIEASDIA